MRALCVAVAAPAFDDDLRLGEAVEGLAVEQFVAELGIEALAVAVILRNSRLDVGSLRADGSDPLPRRFGDELRPVACWEGCVVENACRGIRIGGLRCADSAGSRHPRRSGSCLRQTIAADDQHHRLSRSALMM